MYKILRLVMVSHTYNLQHHSILYGFIILLLFIYSALTTDPILFCYYNIPLSNPSQDCLYGVVYISTKVLLFFKTYTCI